MALHARWRGYGLLLASRRRASFKVNAENHSKTARFVGKRKKCLWIVAAFGGRIAEFPLVTKKQCCGRIAVILKDTLYLNPLEDH